MKLDLGKLLVNFDKSNKTISNNDEISNALESAEVRDDVLDLEVKERLQDEDIKNQALDDSEMEKFIEKIPETKIDDSSVVASKMTKGGSVDVDEKEYTGAQLESYQIEELISLLGVD